MIQDVVIYNLPQHSNLSRTVEFMYMLNIVGSFTICIQPIYGLFEKRAEPEKEKAEDPNNSIN